MRPKFVCIQSYDNVIRERIKEYTFHYTIKCYVEILLIYNYDIWKFDWWIDGLVNLVWHYLLLDEKFFSVENTVWHTKCHISIFLVFNQFCYYICCTGSCLWHVKKSFLLDKYATHEQYHVCKRNFGGAISRTTPIGGEIRTISDETKIIKFTILWKVFYR